MNDLTFNAILLTIAIQCDEDKKHFKHSRCQKHFYKLLSRFELHRCHQHISLSALLDPKESPWKRVLGLRNDKALITLTGWDFVKFKAILQSFKYFFDDYTQFTEGGTIEMLDKAIPQG